MPANIIAARLNQWKQDHPVLPWYHFARYFQHRVQEHKIVNAVLEKLKHSPNEETALRQILRESRLANQAIHRASKHYREGSLHHALKYPTKKKVTPLHRFHTITYGQHTIHCLGTLHTRVHQLNYVGEVVKDAFDKAEAVYHKNATTLDPDFLRKNTDAQARIRLDLYAAAGDTLWERLSNFLKLQSIMKEHTLLPGERYYAAKRDPHLMDELLISAAKKRKKKIEDLTPTDAHLTYVISVAEHFFQEIKSGELSNREGRTREFAKIKKLVKDYCKNRAISFDEESRTDAEGFIHTKKTALLGQRCKDMANTVIDDLMSQPQPKTVFLAFGMAHMPNVVRTLQIDAQKKGIDFEDKTPEENTKPHHISRLAL